MKIAFYIAYHGDIYDWLISLVTFSKYSHCEIVFSDGMCASSSIRDGGVRFKKIDLTDGKWDVFTILDEYDEAVVRQWFIDNDGDIYDLRAAIASAFGIDLLREDRKFCSQACGIPLGYEPVLTPAKLFKKLIRDHKI